ALPGALLQVPPGYFQVATPAQAFWTPLGVLGRYLALTVWPHPLSADYSYRAIPFADGPLDVAPVLAGALACALAAWTLRRKLPSLGAGLAWFGLALL